MQINKDLGLVKAFLHFNRLTKQPLSLLFQGGMQKPSGQREKINEKSKDPVNLEKVPYFSSNIVTFNLDCKVDSQ